MCCSGRHEGGVLVQHCLCGAVEVAALKIRHDASNHQSKRGYKQQQHCITTQSRTRKRLESVFVHDVRTNEAPT
jgi:hypothetical protein